MDKIEKIRQEIESLYDGEVPKHDQQCDFSDGYFTGLSVISNFLDTLSEEPDNEDLNDEIKKYIEEYGYERGGDKLLIAIVARHFAEWGAEHLRDTTKMIDKSLEEEIEMEWDSFNKHLAKYDEESEDVVWLNWNSFKEIASYFAEWQASQMPMPEDTVLFQKGVAEGRRLEREDMMKDAVEGRVFMSFAPGHNQMVMADVDLPTNTKVRVIVLKEEE